MPGNRLTIQAGLIVALVVVVAALPMAAAQAAEGRYDARPRACVETGIDPPHAEVNPDVCYDVVVGAACVVADVCVEKCADVPPWPGLPRVSGAGCGELACDVYSKLNPHCPPMPVAR